MLAALSEDAKALVEEEQVQQLYDAIEALFGQCEADGTLSPDVVYAYSNYCAARGQVEKAVKCVMGHKGLLLSSLPSFIKAVALIVAVATRSPFVLTEACDVKDVQSAGARGV